MAFPLRSVAALLAVSMAGPVNAQQPPTPPTAPPLSITDLRTLAEAQVAIAVVLDSSGAQLAQVRNKTTQAQAEMQAKRRTLVSEALSKKGMTVEEFERRRYLVSTSTTMRFQFDSIVARLTGAPLPGTIAAGPPVIALPAGLVGIAIGYVAANYLDTPDKSGLLAMAQTEAKVAAQHAGFMARTPDNLQTLQMHAGHILHALDPSTMPAATAPGKGYGVKRALQGVVAYTELATVTAGASPNVKMHATHIIAAAQSSSKRADQIIAMARRIQSANSAAAASALVGQLTSLCNELLAGHDLNADGKIVWGDGEGGLQQAQEHMTLLLAGEKKP
jgi:hypothetical protein